MDAKELGNQAAHPWIRHGSERGVEWKESEPGMTLRQHFAGLVDVSVYSPRATFELKFNRGPTVDELAEYIASIRMIEADAILAELAKEPT